MPTPPSPPLWTLNASGLSGGTNSAKLAGCHIAQNSTTSVYTFYDPSWNSLGTFSGTTLTCSFNYNGINNWTVTLSTATSGGNATGGWSTPAQGGKKTGSQSGNYTAQTGAGPISAEEAASSAGYGKS